MDILSQTIDYLEQTVEGFKLNTKTKPKMFTCPICFTDQSCTFIPNGHYVLTCRGKCQKVLGDIVEVVSSQESVSKEDAEKHIIDTLNLNITTNDELIEILDKYEDYGFDLVMVARDAKNPIEKAWTTKVHKDKKEWLGWIRDDNLNIGLKTGSPSNVTVIDVDTLEPTEELKNILVKTNTLRQRTTKGYHYIFQYEADLPKTRIESLLLDIENDGGQVVFHPSVVKGVKREIKFEPIQKMPRELKDFLVSKLPDFHKTKLGKPKVETKVQKPIEDFHYDLIEGVGKRHSIFMHLGGVLRKNLNKDDVELVLNVLNSKLTKPPMSPVEFRKIMQSLDKYCAFDNSELVTKVLRYLEVVEEANSRDVREALGFRKEEIDKVLNHLVKEGHLVKKRRVYYLVKKGQWKDTYLDEGKEIDFDMPYFHDCAYFRNGDMIVVGAKSGVGKTHISMGIVKRLIAQGVKPYYIGLESGSRALLVARKLSIPEGSFYWDNLPNPESIEIEENAVTIIDWLLPNDYAQTDKLYARFAEQLVKKGGVLIIFVQLRQDGEFFAKNMIEMFPSFVVKFMYEDDDGIDSYFITSKIREPKKQRKRKIPTKYIRETKELKTLEEIKEEQGDLNG